MANGVVSNSHVPNINASRVFKELNTLSVFTLFNLTRLWFNMSETEPTNNQNIEWNMSKLTEIKNRNSKMMFKRRLIDAILVEFYPTGLNALQLAQIDVQILIDKPNIYSWTTATIKVSNKEEVIHFDPQTFLNKFVSNLNNLYLCHIYISRHPKYPMYLIRIQIFDHAVKSNGIKLRTKTQFELQYQRYKSGKSHFGSNPKRRQFVQSLKPQYILLPLSTPNVIYTSTGTVPPASGKTNEIEDLSMRLILQTLETTLSTSSKPIQLHHDCKTPLRNLNSVFIVKGNSRFSNSLGPWLPYADNKVDSDLLSEGNDNFRLNPRKLVDDPEDIATLRFKGATTRLQSKKLYDTIDQHQDTKEVPEEIRDDSNEEEEEEKEEDDEVVPIDEFEHILNSGFKIKFVGSNTLDGLLDLAHRGLIDAKKCPDWLTGEDLKL